MAGDTNRRSLGIGLPWAYMGLMLLTVSVAVPAVLSPLPGVSEKLHLALLAPAVGLLGAAPLLVAFFILARARIGGRSSPWLAAGAVAWLLESALRAIDVIATKPVFDAPRVALAGFAMYGFARGIPWLFDHAQPQGLVQRWGVTRFLFGVQLLVFAAVPLLTLFTEVSISAVLARPTFGTSLLWIAFAGPYALLLLTVRRTIGHSPGLRTTEDVLRGPG